MDVNPMRVELEIAGDERRVISAIKQIVRKLDEEYDLRCTRIFTIVDLGAIRQSVEEGKAL